MKRKVGIMTVLIIIVVIMAATGRYDDLIDLAKQEINGSEYLGGSKVISEVVVPSGNAEEQGKSLSENEINYEELENISYTAGYGYQLLNEEEKNIYVEILNAINNLSEDVVISSSDVDQVIKIHEYVCADNPELFWVKGYQVAPYEMDGETVGVKYSGIYTMNAGQKENYQIALKQVTKAWLEEIAQYKEEYDKVKKAYELVILNTEYEEDSSESQNILSVFLNGKSVCQGYAEAFQYLLKHSGIQSILVTGTASNGVSTQPHAWNMVSIGGNYYQFDVTWGEPNYQATEKEKVKWDMSYKYFGITDEEMYRNHTIETEIPLPECHNKEYNYFIKEGYYYTELDKRQLKLQFMEAEKANLGVAHIKCDNGLLYKEFVKYLIEDSKVFYIIRNQTEIQYSLDDDMMCISIFWEV
ncbi:MAG: hypothetical protein IJA36_12565 [Lachnospiraceae bacterium]|nr:hypothetical protein [Lachnospiraceae bacterium]